MHGRINIKDTYFDLVSLIFVYIYIYEILGV